MSGPYCEKCGHSEAGMMRMPDEDGEYWCGDCIRATLKQLKTELDLLKEAAGFTAADHTGVVVGFIQGTVDFATQMSNKIKRLKEVLGE